MSINFNNPKKACLGLILTASAIVMGCDGSNTEFVQSPYENAKKAMSNTENELLTALKNDERERLYPLFYAILAKRVQHSEEGVIVQSPSKNAVPFCDVIDVYEPLTKDLRKRCGLSDSCKQRMLDNQWKSRYGKSLVEECKGTSYVIQKRAEDAKRAKLEAEAESEKKDVERIRKANLDNDTVIIDGERYVSPDMYAKIRTSIVDCERARMDFMDMTKESPYLTLDMYNEINKSILKCESYKTEKAIQEPQGAR
ncbi:hypothetical protein [Vibrio sp. D431a]|uniref:hypothetical protein n=1 Tax=Vibrio sp. D431a TaxID=2837388 RepID=UPI0025550388|nr:hypothetical protein [Vibrio sp. D431a]MDK9789943.1 hypothetical protein [Vibrio sp. D431a]